MQKAGITEGMWVGQAQVCHWDFNQSVPIADV